MAFFGFVGAVEKMPNLTFDGTFINYDDDVDSWGKQLNCRTAFCRRGCCGRTCLDAVGAVVGF